MQEQRLTLLHFVLIAAITASVLVLPGSDVYTHLHQAWLFNHMMENRIILHADPTMLGGNQPLYGVGTPSYIIAGLAWFLLQKSTVKMLEAALFLGIVAITLKMFRNREMLFFWYSLILLKLLLPDSYVYLVSMFLFYLGAYLIYRHKATLGGIAMLAAGLNHPYAAASNVVTLFFKRKKLFLFSIITLAVQLALMKFIFFSNEVNFEIDNLADFTIRTAMLLLPLIAEPLPRLAGFPHWLKLPGRAIRLMNIKTACFLAAASIIFAYPVFFVPFESGWKEGIHCYYQKSYSNVPRLEGNVRIVDECRNWIYAFPLKGVVTSMSPYFEGQYYQTEWTVEKYANYLAGTNTTYIIYFKDCDIKTKTFKDTHELQILSEMFPVYQELEDFTIFKAG